MKIKYLIIMALFCGCASSNLYQANPSDKEVITRVKGYWAVSIGEWSPLYPAKANSPFINPPSRIELQDSRNENGWCMRRLRGTNDVHKFSFYRVISPDTLFLSWSNGYCGLTAFVAIKKDTLVGKAESFYDFVDYGEKASIKLIREK
jgi:hypothetical protein